MTPTRPPSAETIDWQRLLQEFADFEADADIRNIAPDCFVGALVMPIPEFVDVLLAEKTRRGTDRSETVRDLYAYLLEKRYNERLNLLHFAFNVFDAATSLPEDIINRTPLPHEDGVPHYRHHLDPTFRLKPNA
jgi:hypothetical protein